MRILIGGDTHGSRTQINYLFDMAKHNDCDGPIIQVGDFGYSPRREFGHTFLDTVEKLCKKHDKELWWLDGNHEDHDEIDRLLGGHYQDSPVVTKRESKTTPGNIIEFPHIKYLPRGCTFELDGVSFMSYGGAFSIDRAWRTKYVSWFPQEMIDYDHIANDIPDDHVDVLLSHDVPLGYKFGYDEYSQASITSRTAREALFMLVQKITPKVCMGGHHHIYDKYEIQHKNGIARCNIINCDGNGKFSAMLLDTDTIKDL